MAEYLTDLELDSNSDVHLDGANDLALVAGRGNLEQAINIRASDVIEEFVGGKITGTNIALLEERLQQTLDSDPRISNVEGVSVDEFDKRTNTVSITVALMKDESLELEVAP